MPKEKKTIEIDIEQLDELVKLIKEQNERIVRQQKTIEKIMRLSKEPLATPKEEINQPDE